MIPSPRSSGSPTPRIGTPRRVDRPTKARYAEAVASVVGRPLLGWQSHALAVGLETVDGRWAYPDVGVAVARQNGKTGGILEIRALTGLLVFGERILHSAQNRDLPRESFLSIASILESRFGSSIAYGPRRANGQESVTMHNGGSYRIVAPRADAPRGRTADLIILDEVREYSSDEFVAAILPTLNTSADPQVWYASNAGDPDSVVLNELRRRGLADDPSLAWLEWSADPSLDDDDPEAWSQANPSLGILIAPERIAHLQKTLSPERFQTEVLCRWVAVSGTRAIPADLWDAAADPNLAGPSDRSRPVVSIDADPDRLAVAVSAAWILGDGRVGTDLVYYSPTLVGAESEIRRVVDGLSPGLVGFDPWTAQTLADSLGGRYPTEAVTGRNWVAASQHLLDLLTGDRLRHYGRTALSTQLAHAERRSSVEGRWWIARGAEPIPGVTSTARAVYLASRPRPVPAIH
jgi:hypothetical protein